MLALCVVMTNLLFCPTVLNQNFYRHFYVHNILCVLRSMDLLLYHKAQIETMPVMVSITHFEFHNGFYTNLCGKSLFGKFIASQTSEEEDSCSFTYQLIEHGQWRESCLNDKGKVRSKASLVVVLNEKNLEWILVCWSLRSQIVWKSHIQVEYKYKESVVKLCFTILTLFSNVPGLKAMLNVKDFDFM